MEGEILACVVLSSEYVLKIAYKLERDFQHRSSTQCVPLFRTCYDKYISLRSSFQSSVSSKLGVCCSGCVPKLEKWLCAV